MPHPRHLADAIDRAEDRERFGAVLDEARRIAQPAERHRDVASRRRSPSPRASAFRSWCGRRYVLGGRAMAIVYDASTLDGYITRAMAAQVGDASTRAPRSTSSTTRSSSTSTPSPTRTGAVVDRRRSWSTSRRRASTRATPPARCRRTPCRRRSSRRSRRTRGASRSELGGRRPDERAVRGQGRRVYVLEVNPRASRTVPFVSKATGRAAREDRRARAWSAARSRSWASRENRAVARRA